MLKMRLQRIGRRNSPSYRVLVVDSRQGPKSGKFVDQIGSYDPKSDAVSIDGEKAREWIGKGVQVSPTVHNILVGQKVIEGKKVNVLPKKSPIVDEEAEQAAAEATTTTDDAPATDEDAGADGSASTETETPVTAEAAVAEEAEAPETSAEEEKQPA